MIETPIYRGRLQSDLDFAGFNALNFPGGSGSSGSSGGGFVMVNIKDAPYNAAGDGVTDDTAVLQAVIDDLTPLGGGRIYLPPGTYLMAGPLRDTGGRNAQILLPIIANDQPPVVFEIIGALPPPTQFSYYSPMPQPTAYTIIKSTLTGGTGTAAFIAGQETTGGGLASTWDNVMLVVRSLIFQAPPNPTFTAFNCFDIMGSQFYNVLIHCGAFAANDIVEPTHSNAVAIKLAPSNHSAQQEVKIVDVFGFYTALQDGELADNTLNAWGCKQGVLVTFNYFPSIYRTLGLYWCPRGIVAAGVGASGIGGDDGTHYMSVDLLDNEHPGGASQPWQDIVYDVDDVNNLLKGDIKWATLVTNIGNNHTFIKNGGTGLLTTEIGSSTVYIGTDARLTAISGGVKLEVRNTGTGVWVEATRYTNP